METASRAPEEAGGGVRSAIRERLKPAGLVWSKGEGNRLFAEGHCRYEIGSTRTKGEYSLACCEMPGVPKGSVDELKGLADAWEAKCAMEARLAGGKGNR